MLTVWKFRTANFVISLDVAPELDAPDWVKGPELQNWLARIQNDEVAWFRCVVRVRYNKGQLVGSDYLGQCCYDTVEEFYTLHRRCRSGSYFTDMVAHAIYQARTVLGMEKTRASTPGKALVA